MKKKRNHISTGYLGSVIACCVLIAVVQKLVANTNTVSPESHEELAKQSAVLNEKIAWGSLTNSIRAGFYLEIHSDRAPKNKKNNAPYVLSDWRIIPAFSGMTTNTSLVWLSPKSAWKARLIDADGNEVKKTSAGRKLGKPMSVGKRGLQESGFVFMRVDSRFPDMPGKGFMLSDYFQLTQPGDYTLEVCFYGMVVTNSSLLPTQFGPIKKVLQIRNQ